MLAASRPSGGEGRPLYRPLSISEIAEEAEKYEWNPHIPIKYYVTALEALYRQGKSYLREANYAKAYLLLLRFCSLCLSRASTHPEAKSPEGRRLLNPVASRIPAVVDQLEEIKPHIIAAYNEWVESTKQDKRVGRPGTEGEGEWESETEFGDDWGASGKTKHSGSRKYSSHAARDAALSWNSQARATILDASDHQDLAVDLATREFERREAARASTHPASVSLPDRSRQHRPTSSRGGMDYSSVVEDEEGDLRRQMEAARYRLDHPGGEELSYREELSGADYSPAPSVYRYPTISKSSAYHYESRPREFRHEEPAARPPRPPKVSEPQNHLSMYDIPPPVPSKEVRGDVSPYPPYRPASPFSGHEPPPRPPKALELPAKEERVTFQPAGYLEDGRPIRPVFLPEGLRKDFVRLATENTRRGVETCGLLCGTNVNNALFINCLLIPEQHGTPDTCETTNEAATFEFFEKEDLIQIGWIHTHPTQTCFMSSRDLHTQAGYQIMMDESIAIVCAPNHEPSWGIFRLTNPPGLDHLLRCEQMDTFHQHSLPADSLYRDAAHPAGHVMTSARLSYSIHDLRKKD